MENVIPVFKKEMRVYYFSIIAYIVTFAFLAIASLFFVTMFKNYSDMSMRYMQMQQQQYMRQDIVMNMTDMVFTPLIGNLWVVLIFVLPLLTMRLLSEEKKSGTIELIFTYPIKDWDTILGKYFASGVVFILMMVLTLIYPLFMKTYGDIEFGPFITAYGGIILMGLGYIAFGLFISSITENQVVAAVLTIAGGLFFWIVGWMRLPANPIADAVIGSVAFMRHFQNFARGLVDIADVIYFVLFGFFCLFLTTKVLESNKWRG